jgi:hypothetical protein
MLDRLVTQIEPYPEDFEQQKPRPFRDFLNGHDIVLLGDPGLGKTHTFRHAAESEGADYRTVQQFVIFEGESSHGKTVYLDALDEFRSRRGDRGTVAQIVHLVHALNRPKIRLSCRAADWLGNTDLAIFRELGHEKGLVVLRLEPLTEAQVLHIAQSRSTVEAQNFWTEATERGLEGLIGNPQTLIMLLDVVTGGVWPKTRKELYERSATLLLAEPNEEHTRAPLGQFEALELLEAAGAACALMLISDLPGLSLRENSLDAYYPSYRRVPCGDPQKVEAALCRRAFFAVGNEQVKYIHRTVAEFLAAKWLVARLRNGLPLGRIQSLICVEGVPAPELRGLYAWLATLSPEHAPALIPADPYGVLVYGDAASMPPSLRKALLDALQRLARSDPWFRAGDWTDMPLGGLSGPEMVGAFRSVLSDRNSGLHLRSVVLDAIEHGPVVPELRDDLVAILADGNCPDTERLSALDGLLKVIPGGVEAVVKVYRNHLIGNRSTARLRAHILAALYPRHFTTEEIVAVFSDVLNGSEGHAIGELWSLSSSIPEPYLPEVLSALGTLNRDEDVQARRQNKLEVARAFSRLLHRLMSSNLPKRPIEIWTWLSVLYRLEEGTVGTSSQEAIKKCLQDMPSLVLSMFDIAVERASIHDLRRLLLIDFLRTISNGISYGLLASHIFDVLNQKARYDGKDHEMYQFAIGLCFGSDETTIRLFEQLYMLGDRDPILHEKRDAPCICQIEEWHWKEAQRKLQNAQKALERRERD